MDIYTELCRSWAAGFYDGEGSFTNTATHSPVMRVGQSGDPLVLVRFREAVGIGKVYGPYNNYNKNYKKAHQPSWVWSVSGRNKTAEVLLRLWPYLSTPKKEQARKVLDRYDAQVQPRKDRERIFLPVDDS